MKKYPIVKTQVQEVTDELTKCCNNMFSTNKNFKPVEPDLLWKVLFQVAAHDDGNFILMQTMLSLYRECVPTFNHRNDVITSNTCAYLDKSKPFEERTANAKAIVKLMPFFNFDLLKQIILASIDLINVQINQLNDIPIKFLELFSGCQISAIGERIVKPVIKFLKAEVQNEDHNHATLLLISPMVKELTSLDKKFNTYFLDALLKTIKKEDRNSKLVGLYMFMYVAPLFQHNIDSFPSDEEILGILKPLLSVPDPILRKRATKVFRILIYSDIILPEQVIDEFLDDFETFPKEYLTEYFKILSYFVVPFHNDADDNENPEDVQEDQEANFVIIQPIFDFVSNNIESENTTLRALCLNTMSFFFGRNISFAKTHIPKALGVAQNLLDSKQVDTYVYISNLIGTLAKKDASNKDRIESMTRTIIQQLLIENNEAIGNLNQQIKCANNISTIINSDIAVDQSDNIAKFALNILKSNPSEKITGKLCQAIHSLIKNINKESAIEIFKNLSEKIKICEDPMLVDVISVCLERIIANHKPPEELVRPLVDDSINGKFKLLNNTPADKIFPPNILPFLIMSIYIKNYPSQSSNLIPMLVEWLSTSQIQTIPSILIPINAALDSRCFNDETAGTISEMIKDLLNQCKLANIDEVCALCNTANKLYKSFPLKMGNIVEYIQPLVKFVTKDIQSSEEEEEEEEEDFDMPEDNSLAYIANFVFNVYASDEQVGVNIDLVTHLLLLLPFEPGCDVINEILCNLAEMFNNKNKFSAINVLGLRIIAEILMMNKVDIEKFKIETKTLDNLKQTLNRCCNDDKKLGPKIIREFGRSTAKISKFRSLIQQGNPPTNEENSSAENK